jgi:GGDEF domain-containing protein
MISIRRLLDRSPSAPGGDELLETALRLRGLLRDAQTSRRSLPRDLGTPDFQLSARKLLQRIEQAATPQDLAELATDSLHAAEDYIARMTEFADDHGGHMQSMVAMLTKTVADVTGQSEASIARLQGIEQRLERTSGLDDIRALKDSMAECLVAVKEAVAQQKKDMRSTVERLQEQIKRAPQPPIAKDPPPSSGGSARSRTGNYVAAFRLQHADHILKRFGESARDEMLAMIGKVLETAQGPNDRLMRWKGPSFVMFLSSNDNLPGIHRRISGLIAKISQRYVELGKNAALLAVGVDWAVFPQSKESSLDVVFEEVDAFITKLQIK